MLKFPHLSILVTHTYSAILILWLLLSQCTTPAPQVEEGTIKLPQGMKLNQIQVLGTHNSYAKPVDSAVLTVVDQIMEENREQFAAAMSEEQQLQYRENHPNEMKFSEALAYDHPDYPTQLDAGLRSLEMDVYYDPTGNRFTQPASYAMLNQMGQTDLLPHDTTDLDQPGFKVLHVADVDFRTHYTTFQQALTALKSWSDAHPSHVPIFVMIEAKDKGFPIFPNPTEVLPFSTEAFDELDQEVLTYLGRDKLITPDDIRGDYETLEEAVLAHNWPEVTSVLGKFVFLLLPATAGIGSGENLYVTNHPSLADRVMFVQSDPGQPYAAFLLRDNAIMRQEDIQQAVEAGYLVRSRADIDCYEAKVNDTTRAQAAFMSGAQVISTDFFKPGNVFGTDYYITLPNKQPIRVNPVNGE